MQLAPGPIPTLQAGQFDSSTIDPGLEAQVTAALAGLPDLEASMDNLVDPVAPIDDALPDDGGGPMLDDAMGNLGALSAYDPAPDVTAIDQAANEGDEAMLNVYAAIPGEAFQDVPAPLVIPGTPVGPPAPNPATAAITNLTRPGDPNFQVGDQWRITVNVQPLTGGGGKFANQPVTANPMQNGVVQPSYLAGVTDSFGVLTFTGTFQPSDGGAWGVTFTVADANTGPTVTYTVNPAGGPITVLLENLTNPSPQPAPGLQGRIDLQPFKVGDQWRLTVTGAPNTPVNISATQDGVDIGTLQAGSTDPSGTFVLTGAMSTAELGSWVEHYTLGDVPWAGELVFFVGQ